MFILFYSILSYLKNAMNSFCNTVFVIVKQIKLVVVVVVLGKTRFVK